MSRARRTIDVNTTLPAHVVAAFTRNVCQESISTDALLSSIAGLLFMLQSTSALSWPHTLGCCVASAVFGPATGLALFCAHREEDGRSTAITAGVAEPKSSGGGGSSNAGAPSQDSALKRSARLRAKQSGGHFE